MKIKLVHDLISFLLSVLLGLIVSYYQPVLTSLGVLLFTFSAWLVISCYFMQVDFKHALDPRLARSSVGSILALISLVMILVDLGLESRIIGAITIIVIIALVLNIHYLSKKTSSS